MSRKFLGFVKFFNANGFKYYGSTVSSIEKGRGVLYTGMKVIGGHHYYFFVSTKDGHYGKTLAVNRWVSTNATINKTTGYATVDWNGWEGINWSNANKYTSFYVTK